MKRTVYLLLLVNILSVCLYIFINYSQSEQNLKSTETNDLIELTIKKASQIGLNHAKKTWNSNAELISITSVDGNKGSQGSQGSQGKRQRWNLLFYNPKSNETLIETIHNGKIVKSIQTNEIRKKENTINFDKVLLDSSDILKKAQKDFSIQPGIDWAKGYHFVLEKKENESVIGVVARDNKGRLTKIFYNANTGKLRNSIYKTPYGGGLTIVDKNGTNKIFSDSSITGVDLSGSKISFWGLNDSLTKKVNSIASVKDGNEYLKMDIKGIVQAVWHLDKNESFVIGNNSIKLYQNNQFIKEVFRTPDRILKTSQNKNGLIILTSKQIFAYTKDDRKWIELKRPSNTSNVFIKPNKDLYAWSKDGNIFVYKNSKWAKVKYPKNKTNGRIVTLVDSNIVFATADNVTFLNLKNQNKRIIQLPSSLNQISYDENSNKFFLQHKGGEVSNILKGGDDKWLLKKTDLRLDGNLSEATETKEGTIYFATTSEFKWVPYE